MDKQLLVDYTVFEVSPQAINESLTQNNGKLIVSGVLQRAEAKNQNGRVYPKETLMREAKKYANEFISERNHVIEFDDEKPFQEFCLWMQKHYGTSEPVDMDEEPSFSKYHDATQFGVLACNVHKYTFIVNKRS
jgi:hypothetical protein